MHIDLKDKIFVTSGSGNHYNLKARRGIFLIKGSDIKRKRINCKIYDVLPTVLYILGVDIPEDIDGRVITEVFKEGDKSEIKYQKMNEKQRIKDRVSLIKLRKKI